MRVHFFAALAAGLVGAVLMGGMAAAQDRSDWPRSVSIGTGSEGGTYFAYGTGLAALMTETLGIKAEAVATGGPVQNAAMVQTGDLDIGMVTMGPAYAAWAGESPLAPGLKHDSLRALFPMYQTPFQIVALRSSGIDTIKELAGKTVGVGPAGSTSDTYFPLFLGTLGIDIVKQNGGTDDLAGQLRDGLIDAFAFAAGVPIAPFSQLAAEAEVNIFSFNAEQIATLVAAHPSATEFTVPADTYDGIDKPQGTVAVWNFAITTADLPESLAYEIVKTVMENNGRMTGIHRAAGETLPANARHNAFLPFHPGAVRWFEENGFDIPEDLEG